MACNICGLFDRGTQVLIVLPVLSIVLSQAMSNCMFYIEVTFRSVFRDWSRKFEAVDISLANILSLVVRPWFYTTTCFVTISLDNYLNHVAGHFWLLFRCKAHTKSLFRIKELWKASDQKKMWQATYILSCTVGILQYSPIQFMKPDQSDCRKELTELGHIVKCPECQGV